ncbi:MAG: SCO family protein, partial [Dongiaceae bacterium]
MKASTTAMISSRARKRISASVATVLCLLLVASIGGAAAPSSAHSLEDLENALGEKEHYLEVVNRPAPGFNLQDSEGRPFSLDDFRGKVLVLYFIYTSCPDVCPLHSDRLAAIQEKINGTPMREAVKIVAITTDPERDTADVMRAYGALHGLDDANYLFLTSGADRPAETRGLAEQYGLKFTLEDGGYQMHGVVTHLIDKSGNLRARYHGLKFDDTNLIVHVNALVNDY